jgi:hypothetical protein
METQGNVDGTNRQNTRSSPSARLTKDAYKYDHRNTGNFYSLLVGYFQTSVHGKYMFGFGGGFLLSPCLLSI